MKGIVIDCKTGKMKEVNDGLPMPEFLPYTEPEGIDLVEVAQKLKELDIIKADVEQLKAKVK